MNRNQVNGDDFVRCTTEPIAWLWTGISQARLARVSLYLDIPSGVERDPRRLLAILCVQYLTLHASIKASWLWQAANPWLRHRMWRFPVGHALVTNDHP